jgi:hypothetical protein
MPFQYFSNTKAILPLIWLGSTIIASAYTAETISEMELLDSGGGATIDSNANHSQDATTGIITKTGNGGTISHVSGELNLLSFTISTGTGNTTYKASEFISGVTPNTIIENGSGTGPATVAYVLQPADYLTKTSNGGTGRTTANNSGFFAGTTDANGDLANGADYLISGERGLSYSTALNYRATVDQAQVLTIPLEFLQDPLSTSVTRPTFFAGDAAKNQNNDTWRFKNDAGDTIAELTIRGSQDSSGSDWNQFGSHTVDRLSTDWDGSADDFDDDKTLNIALLAFKLTADDFLINGDDRSGRWDEITKLELVLPDPDAGSVTGTSTPMTDYAFIGIDLGMVASSTAKVPEPGTGLLLGLSGITLLLRRSRHAA